MSSKKDASQFTHWRRPASRMYQYNYDVAESYYKPQVKYIESPAHRALGPPGAKTFMERWAADPFYGRTETLGELSKRGLVRASSVPKLLEGGDYFFEDLQNAAENIRESRSRCRSVSRERSVALEECSRVRARSLSRSPSPRRSDYYGDDARLSRRARGWSVARSHEDVEAYVDTEWRRDQEFEDLLRMANREERESSVFNLRMALEDPVLLAKKLPMKTTVGPGFYSNTLYGKHIWNPVLRNGKIW